MPSPSVEPSYRDVTVRASWRDFRTLVGFAAVVAASFALSRVGERTAFGVAADLRNGFAGVPQDIATVLLGLVLGGYLVMVAVAPVWLAVQRRFALLGRVLLGAFAGLVGYGLIVRVSSIEDWLAAIEAAARDISTPGAWEIAAFAAVTAVATPAMSHRWSRIVWSVLVLLALVRVVSTSAGPVGVLLAVGAGGMAGALLLLALGRAVSTITPAGARRVLAGVGVDLDEVTVEPSGEWDMRGTDAAGAVLIRVLDEHEWRADRMRRGYRRLRWRERGDDSPFGSPIRAVANEAMVGLLAQARGVQVAPVLGVVAGHHGEALIAVRAPAGPTLADLGERLGDDVLDAAWQQVRGLADARIAVRELTTAHLVLTDTGVVVVDLAQAQPAASDGVLAGDVAELLASTAVQVGPERAVRVAHRVLGPDRLVAALSRLVPAALSPATRSAIRVDGGLNRLVGEVSAVVGVDEPQFEQLERLRPRTLVMAAMFAAAVYVLAPQLTDLPTLGRVVAGADWRWVVPLMAASVATYVGAGLGLVGGTPGRVPVGQAVTVAVASSFVAAFTPPGVGQVGMNVRFLQKRGFPMAVAASGSAAKEAAVLVVHLSLLAGFAVWAGSTEALTDELSQLPSPAVAAAVGGGALTVVGLALAVPRVRRLVFHRLVPALRSSAEAMRDVISRPGKVVALFGGVLLLPLGYALALYFAVRAFGADPSFVAVVLVSLTAGALATAAPTPGGLGAVEAVLLAALTGLGVASEAALAGVMLYRIATFWLPIAPGALAFRALTARGVL